MNFRNSKRTLRITLAGLVFVSMFGVPTMSNAQTKAMLPSVPPAAGQKSNIVLIVSDDFGYGDAGAYGGGVGRGMPTPGLDRVADEGMTFFSYYAQPSCTAGRAAMLTGRIPNLSIKAGGLSNFFYWQMAPR
jgi:arylsulfatase